MQEQQLEQIVKAATVAGFRQCLEQTAAQLRRQTAAWRAEAESKLRAVDTARLPKRNAAQRAESRKLVQSKQQAVFERHVTEQWCARVDEIAALLEAEARKRLSDENALRSQALQHESTPGLAARLLAAFFPEPRKR